METFRARYRWTKENLIEARKHHYQTNLRPSIVMMMNAWIFLLAAMSLFIIFDGAKPLHTGAAFVFVGFAAYWFFLRRMITPWWIARDFDKRPDANTFVNYEFSKDSLKSHCEGLAQSEVQWKLFIRIVETSEGFLLYSQNSIFYWLPFSAFEEKEGIEKFSHFAKENCTNYVVTSR